MVWVDSAIRQVRPVVLDKPCVPGSKPVIAMPQAVTKQGFLPTWIAASLRSMYAMTGGRDRRVTAL